MGSMRVLIQTAIDVIEALPNNLTLAPSAVNALNTPNTITENVFSIDVQTVNTDKFRDRSPSGHARLGHSVQVSLLFRIFPLNQMQSYLQAIDTEEAIIKGLLVQASTPAYRVLYTRSSRRLTESSEYLLIEIDFDVEQSISVT
jgi:hypothetical protein